MNAKITKESYKLVEKLAYKFTYSTDSIEYDQMLSVGLEGLIKAIETYKDGTQTDFSTYATTCIRNAMCTAQTKLNRLDVKKDDNVIIEDISHYETPTDDENIFTMCKEVERIVKRINHNNKRNTDIVLAKFGVFDAPMDYKDISVKFNISAERVRQLCTYTMKEIKKDKNATELLYSFVG